MQSCKVHTVEFQNSSFLLDSPTNTISKEKFRLVFIEIEIHYHPTGIELN